ncbi:bifunctional diguanylate cyclase/phosphodiesterase [uncultured Roseobacter sp.]|uniref:putative bifunctional diguanylate cyclase/phosphodiesterase n=1 Tax=uncultured Roseobacter sp. TaxID=114847 RepID=UPI00262E6E84|nr:GGDEF domain-containing phosphodiesterase [uncultured Roseobacter sp.]
MNVDQYSSKARDSSFLKRSKTPLAFVFCMTVLIGIGLHLAIDWAVNKTIMAKAEHVAMIWASNFDAELTDLETITQAGALSERQQQVIDAALSFSEVYSFTVFDPQGVLIYSSDYGVATTPSEQSQNLQAKGVFASQSPAVDIIKRTSASDVQNVFVQVFVPAIGAEGTPIGTVGLFLDKTQSAAVYAKVMGWFGWLLPGMCAILYALPAFAYVMKREQVHARTKKLALLSRFDQLTGTLNRHSMNAACHEIFEHRKPDDMTGVFFLDIDKFKTVNDEYSHEFGDAYLQFVSSALASSVRSGDLIGRMGGDEFVIVLPNATLAEMHSIGDAILQKSRAPFAFKGTTIQASVSIGFYLADAETPKKDALHAADLALYHAKANGRNTMMEYFPELDKAMLRRREVETRMRDALRSNTFEAVFQPINNPQDKSIVGFEALLRLDDKDGEPIPPDEFIPIAEETGMIHPLGRFVLESGLTAAKSWPDHVFLSVNLSPAQFKHGNLVDQVAELLETFDFPGSRLEFEVTEGLLMADEQRVSDQLIGLKQLGISIAMDDFGTGYSSLGYLWKYDFDKLKIDRVFLEGFDFDRERYQEIIETIVVLGHKMGMQVTIEGVETERQHDMLDLLACDQYQGFYFGRPMPADQALKALSEGDDNVSAA